MSLRLMMTEKTIKARIYNLCWKIRDAEEKYTNLEFNERRNIHRQGTKARFLLAGVLQHRPSRDSFNKVPISSMYTEAGGPSEFCPVIDIFDDVRKAREVFEEWKQDSSLHTEAYLEDVVTRAEQTAWNVRVLFEAVERGGDSTPRLGTGTETLPEFCMRIYQHHQTMPTMPDGFAGLWVEVPTNDEELGSQQVIEMWNELCRRANSHEQPLDEVIRKLRHETNDMKPVERAWIGQTRTWFAYVP